jgi:hypothetical protein
VRGAGQDSVLDFKQNIGLKMRKSRSDGCWHTVDLLPNGALHRRSACVTLGGQVARGPRGGVGVMMASTGRG